MDPPTILALKQAFVERVTRQLGQPLVPSRAWRRKSRGRDGSTHAVDKNSRLPPKAVDDALARTNQLLLQHARRIYPPSAVRHVAEQLDQLYRQDADDAAERRLPHDEPMVNCSTLYDPPLLRFSECYANQRIATSTAIASLPPTWDDAREAEALPLEARRYAILVQQLVGLAARRTAMVARVRQLRRMAALVEGLGPSPASANPADISTLNASTPPLQDSLVTRDGPIENELERMRVLLARVGDRVSSLPRNASGSDGSASSSAGRHRQPSSEDVEGVEIVGERRVQALLGQF